MPLVILEVVFNHQLGVVVGAGTHGQTVTRYNVTCNNPGTYFQVRWYLGLYFGSSAGVFSNAYSESAWIHTLVQEEVEFISKVFLLLPCPFSNVVLSKMYRFFIHNNQVKCSIPHEDYEDSIESLDAASPIIGGEYNSYIDHEADEYPSLWQYDAETQQLYKLDI